MRYNEEILIDRVRQGDSTAQRGLYDSYANRLLSVSMRYVGRGDVAEDILHDAFIKIFNSIDRFEYRGEGSLRAWMERITINTALEWLRTNKRIDFVALNSEYKEHNIIEEPSYNQTERIPKQILMQFIAELPDGYRTVFNLFCIEGYSHREIAHELNIAEKSSSSQLLRAKRLLAKRINEYIERNERD